MDNEYVYYNKPTPKEPIVMDEVEASLPMWEICFWHILLINQRI